MKSMCKKGFWGEESLGEKSVKEEFLGDPHNRLVTVLFVNSKGDQESRGLSRTLQCICKEGCALRCPYSVLEVLVSYAGLKGSPEAMLSTTQKAAEIVPRNANWSMLGAHSTVPSSRAIQPDDPEPFNTSGRAGQ